MSKLDRRAVIAGLAATPAALALAAPAAAQPAATAVRLSLEEFAQLPRLVDGFRKGVKAMKARKPSDPLSWFFQAAIHGVTDEAKQKALAEDPAVARVDPRYWNQCPHFGATAANFLPWHRGYTYYFEQILRMHTGENDFAIPYWNYTDPANRKFPRILGVQHLDGDLDNDADDNINPLFHPERDFYFTGYEHPLTDQVPLLYLTPEAVDISLPMATPIFFGATDREGLGGGNVDADPRTRGLLESYPHDQIHRSVGGVIGDYAGAMASPPTAAFDPAFSVHHSNIDRLWREWAAMPGKSWGVLPPDDWFAEKAWFFFDTAGQVVNRPRREFFDLKAFGVTYKGHDPNAAQLELPAASAPLLKARPARRKTLLVSAPLLSAEGAAKLSTHEPTRLALGAAPAAVRPTLKAFLDPRRPSDERIAVRLRNVSVRGVRASGFDVHLVGPADGALTRASPSFLGSLTLFVHDASGGGGHHHGQDDDASETFDATRALAALPAGFDGKVTLIFQPYALLASAEISAKLASPPASVDGVDLVRMTLPALSK